QRVPAQIPDDPRQRPHAPAGVEDPRLLAPGRAAAHELHALQPPSTTWIAPVVYDDSSLARYTTSAAISSAVPSLPIGCRATNAARAFSGSPCAAILPRNDGVSTVPGHTALQRIPFPTKSAATAFVSPITAAFVAP